MKRSTMSLNSAGSSRLSTWPDLGKNVSPDAGRCFFRNRLGSTQAWSSSPQKISAGIVAHCASSGKGQQRTFCNALHYVPRKGSELGADVSEAAYVGLSL